MKVRKYKYLHYLKQVMIDFQMYMTNVPEINYWLILSQHSQDDPVLIVNILERLDEAFELYKIKMPEGLHEDMTALREQTKSKLSSLIAQSKRKFEELTSVDTKKNTIMNKGSIDHKKKLTRTQEIFGDSF